MTRPRAVIFDLDGTLTEPVLDFDAIRAEIGLPPGLPILEQLEALDAGGAGARRGDHGAARARRRSRAPPCPTAAPICSATCGELEIPIAILTRNVREVVETFARTFAFRFHAVYTREDGPPKPSPAGALALCRAAWASPPARHAGGRRLQVRRDGRARAPAAAPRWSAARPLADHELADWGSPDMVIQSLRELLPLFGRR